MDTGQHCKIGRQGDRLSSLPNDLIHKILSFVSIKEAIQTSALSSSWRFIWTSLPYLSFSTKDFDTLPYLNFSSEDLYSFVKLAKFDSFVTRVLSRRNNQIEVSSIKLSFHGDIIEELVKKVVDYAFSHNVQQLTITSCRDTRKMELPLSPSLKHLTLTSFKPTSTWEFPALTTLYLSHITLYGDNVCLFSKCANLKNLTLNHFTIARSSAIVDFCHSGLSNLRLENVYLDIGVMNMLVLQLKNLSLVRPDIFRSSAVLNVVAPQLKNLTVKDWPLVRLNLLSAPELGSYLFKGSYSPCVFCSLDKVDLSTYEPFRIYKPNKTEAHKIASLLQQLHSAKHLTLSWDIIQLLSSFMELISYQPSPFANLKSLKVYPRTAWSNVEETMPSGVKKYLLDGSPGATFTMISSKEMIALENAESAQKLMAELQVLLEQEKNNTKTNRAYMDLGKAPTESNEPNMHEQGNAQVDKMQHHDNKGRMSDIISCWKDLSVEIEKWKEKTYDILSKLHQIEVLLTNLPASKKPKIQACYSGLRAEAHTVINDIIDCMSIKCNEKQSRLSVCYRELNTGPTEPPPPKGPPVGLPSQSMSRYPSEMPVFSHYPLVHPHL